MKLTKKSLGPLLFLVLIGAVIGSLTWALLENLLQLWDIALSLSVGPVGFDLEVISFSMRFNPGSLAGAAGGWILFARMK